MLASGYGKYGNIILKEADGFCDARNANYGITWNKTAISNWLEMVLQQLLKIV